MTQPTSQHATSSGGSGSGGGFLSKLRGQAEAALHKLPAMDELQHSVRQQYVASNPRQSGHTLRLQLAIKGEKGVIIDQEALARETKSFSKNILDFVRQESPNPAVIDTADIQDVGDRIAFLTYKTGELHSDYAKELERTRTSLKDIRNHEHTLQQQRDRRAQLERDIGKLRTTAKPDTNTQNKLAQAQAELDQYTVRDSPLMKAEAEAIALRRRKMAEAFSLQFEALQQLGEKLAIIGSYGRVLVSDWDTKSANVGEPESYTFGARTASVRSGVEQDLAHWTLANARTPKPNVLQGSSSSAASIHAPSFHESHRDELASIRTDIDPLATHNQALDSYYQQPDTPPAPPPRHPSDHSAISYVSGSSSAAPHAPGAFPPSSAQSSSAAPVHIPGVGTGMPSQSQNQTSTSPLVHQLNTAPTTTLPGSQTQSTVGHQDPFHDSYVSPRLGATTASSTGAPELPTVAETGVPVTSGTNGPSSGVLAPPPQKSKDEEAREDLDRRFEQFSGQSGGAPASAPGTNAGSGAGLDRELSLHGRREGEQLPAYESQAGIVPPPERRV